MTNVQTRTLAQLPVASALAASDLLVISQGGITKSLVASLINGINTNKFQTFNTLADLKAYTPVSNDNNSIVYLKGRLATEDGCEGLFQLTTTNPGTSDNNGTIFALTVGGWWALRQFDDGLGIMASWFNGHSATVSESNAAWKKLVTMGTKIECTPGASSYIASTMDFVSGTNIFLNNSTMYVQTSTGGFNSKNLSLKGTTSNVVFLVSACENVGIIGPGKLTQSVPTDEFAINPIWINGGFNTSTFLHPNLKITGIPAGGSLITYNSIGKGGYYGPNNWWHDCLVTRGSTYWTGTPGTTGAAWDDALTSAAGFSNKGFLPDLRIENLSFTGSALSDFGDQTDGLTTTRRAGGQGPTIEGLFISGVGEGIDAQGQNMIVNGGFIEKCTNFGIKVIHGGNNNQFTFSSITSVGGAAIIISESTTATVDCERNVFNIGTIDRIGNIAVAVSATAILFGSAGVSATSFAKNNIVNVGAIYGTSTVMSHAIQGSLQAGSTGNIITYGAASGWANSLVAEVSSNQVQILSTLKNAAKIGLTNNQTIPNNVETKVSVDVTRFDNMNSAVPTQNKVKATTPQDKLVTGSIRMSGPATACDVQLTLYQGTQQIAVSQNVFDATTEKTFTVQGFANILNSTVGTSAAEFYFTVLASSASVMTVQNTATMTFLQINEA